MFEVRGIFFPKDIEHILQLFPYFYSHASCCSALSLNAVYMLGSFFFKFSLQLKLGLVISEYPKLDKKCFLMFLKL